MTYTLLTGASSGIGFELASVFARHKRNLILVARSEAPMQELKKNLQAQFQVDVQVVPFDLSEYGSGKILYELTQSKNWNVDCLVNNAGFGDHGPFVQGDPQRITDMIQVNVTALTDLCRLYLPAMLKNRSGQILNVASTAAFQPGPLMSEYYATKAYVLHFTEGLAEEIKDSGVTVTALCPGPTTSGFQKAANLVDVPLFDLMKVPDSKEVAEYAYKAMQQGKVIAIHGLLNYITATTVGFLPRVMARRTAMRLQQKRLKPKD